MIFSVKVYIATNSSERAEVKNIKSEVASSPKIRKRRHTTSAGWKPGWNEIGDSRRGYFSDVDSPPGTDPDSAMGEFIKFLLWGQQSDLLHISAIGSFRMHATVDDVDLTKCTATINIWMSNTMDRASFGRFAEHPLVALSAMKPQLMWWNWKEKIAFDAMGNYTTLPRGSSGSSGW